MSLRRFLDSLNYTLVTDKRIFLYSPFSFISLNSKKELFLNADTEINIINIEVADLSAQERFMKLQHGWFQCYVHRLSSWYNNIITRRLSLSFWIQVYMVETVLLRGTEKRILICGQLVSSIERKITDPESQWQDEVIGIQKH